MGCLLPGHLLLVLLEVASKETVVQSTAVVVCQDPAIDSGMHRLSNARTATVSHTVENGSCATGSSSAQVAVMDHTADGGRVDELVFAQTPAIDSGVHRLSNARTPTVSLSLANTQLLSDDAMPVQGCYARPRIIRRACTHAVRVLLPLPPLWG